MNNFIAYSSATYIRDLTVHLLDSKFLEFDRISVEYHSMASYLWHVNIGLDNGLAQNTVKPLYNTIYYNDFYV